MSAVSTFLVSVTTCSDFEGFQACLRAKLTLLPSALYTLFEAVLVNFALSNS